jgi:diaminohydroxyphosphoribosylaminopyrimidine deaminase / 5-amino-6-(5-phosphoribosylamino)uracil reductase
MLADHETFMRLAIAQAELARGGTGDNPWVGCVITGRGGEVIARGYTQGPGEDHAEIMAFREAIARGLPVEGATMYSTLEPCAFHGRTPACSRVIVDRGIGLVVTGMRDPHPRVDGEGARILRDAGVAVIEGVCEREVRRQLGVWVLAYHPHEPLRRARSLAEVHSPREIVRILADLYAVDPAQAERLVSAM